MQLKKDPLALRRALAMAGCALLSTAPHSARAATGVTGWQSDAAVLGYSETDRVTVTEPVFNLRRSLGDDEYLSLKYVYDSMTGASPNGATAASTPQTFTSPSGTAYTVAPGDTPLRDFRDTRSALSAEWEKPLSRMLRGVFGVNYSTETDYTSSGLSATLALDINDRLTTLTAGASVSADTVDPEGGTPTGLAVTSASTTEGSNDKDSVDAVFGVTQVVNRRTLTQLNYTHGTTDGYLTDPYKIVSVIDGTSGDTVGYRYEKRPDSRTRDALLWTTAHQFQQDVVHFSYRYFWDDWGIKAHTVDLKYRYEFGGGHYLQPHLRWSAQTAADFYTHSLVNGAPLPAYASADYRLGEMTTSTIGVKYGIDNERRGNVSMRVEYMQQSGDGSPADAIGSQQSQDLFPTVDAWIVQFSYSKAF